MTDPETAMGFNDEHLLALGRVTARYSWLQAQLSGLVAALLEMTANPYAEVVTAELHNAQLGMLAGALGDHRFRERNPELNKRIRRALAAAQKASDERNRLVHGFWVLAGVTEPNVLKPGRIDYRARGKITKKVHVGVSVSDLEEVSDHLEAAAIHVALAGGAVMVEQGEWPENAPELPLDDVPEWP